MGEAWPPRALPPAQVIMAEAAARVNIFYASFSGTAEGFAGALARECDAAGLPVRCANLKDFSPNDFRLMDNIVFVVATHYEGESPDDANDFRGWVLDARADKAVFAGKRVALFGLGDRSYDQFNRFGRDVETFLRAAGAVFVLEPAFGNDEHGNIEADFLLWKEALLPALHHAAAGPPAPAAPAAAVMFRLNAPFESAASQHGLSAHYERLAAAQIARVVAVSDARALSTRLLRTFEVWLELPEAAAYSAADNIMLFLPNPAARVAEAAALYGITADDRVFVDARAAHRLPFENGLPAMWVLEHLVDLHGALR